MRDATTKEPKSELASSVVAGISMAFIFGIIAAVRWVVFDHSPRKNDFVWLIVLLVVVPIVTPRR